jgi:hypothetical protein
MSTVFCHFLIDTALSNQIGIVQCNEFKVKMSMDPNGSSLAAYLDKGYGRGADRDRLPISFGHSRLL